MMEINPFDTMDEIARQGTPGSFDTDNFGGNDNEKIFLIFL
jgi:hypothetical protein